MNSRLLSQLRSMGYRTGDWVLLRAFFLREIRNRYAESIGGGLWTLFHPLVLLGIYALVFRTIFQVRFPELGQHAFVEFVAVALWPWLAFQEGIQRGAQTIRAHAGLVKKVSFPNELLVVSTVSATFSVHLAGFAIVLSTLALFGGGLHFSGIPIVLVALSLLFVLTLAGALLCAALQVFIPDTEQFLGPFFMILFYATPILYPLSLVPGEVADFLGLNPLTYFVEPIRSALLQGQYKYGLGETLVWSATPFAYLAALRAFRRFAPYFEDFL